MFLTKKRNVYFVTHGEEKNVSKLPNFNSIKVLLENSKIFLGSFVSVVFYGKMSSIKKFLYEVAIFKVKFLFENLTSLMENHCVTHGETNV